MNLPEDGRGQWLLLSEARSAAVEATLKGACASISTGTARRRTSLALARVAERWSFQPWSRGCTWGMAYVHAPWRLTRHRHRPEAVSCCSTKSP